MIDRFDKNHKFSEEINKLIPGGAHTYSKGDDQFPYNAPKGIVKGKGVYVWDVDDNKYIDWAMGLTSVGLGHAYEPVLQAVREQLELGVNFQRPATIELEFAQLLQKVFPEYDMFKFAKNGSTVTTAAIKLARAYTGRRKVAICAEHPFFSYDDWFIGSTPCDLGVPSEGKELVLKFNYNDLDSVKAMFEKNKDEIACVILEPTKFEAPKDKFLHKLQEECKKNGAVFILDEMITGFRFDVAGAARYFDITPDLATFGKAVGNGFSVAFLAGKREIMELGGLVPGKEKVFLISTTHGAETHGLAAAMKTIQEMIDHDVCKKNWEKGHKIVTRVKQIIEEKGLKDFVEIIGYDIWPAVLFRDSKGEISMAYRTLFMQEMIKRGILFQGTFTIAYEHSDVEIDETMKAFEESCDVYKKALEEGSVDNYLIGEAVKPVFRKYI